MLATLLQEETVALAALCDSLCQEYAALKAHNLDALKQAASKKQVCTDHLQTLLEQQAHHLHQHGFAANADGISACLASATAAERAPLETLWTALQEVASRAQQQNKINGAIITASRSHIERALCILQGHDAQTCLYDQDAQTTFGSGPHSLARA